MEVLRSFDEKLGRSLENLNLTQTNLKQTQDREHPPLLNKPYLFIS